MSFKKILTGFLFVSMFVSCNNDEFFSLERPPYTPWQSVSEFEMAVVYTYSQALHSGWGGGYVNINNMIMEAMTDIVYMVKGASANYPHDETYNRLNQSSPNLTLSRLNESYNQAFNAINNINVALNYYDNPGNWYDKEEDHPFYDLRASEEVRLNIMIGELYFMRALAYYNLCMVHAPAPGQPGFGSEKVLPYRDAWESDPATQRFPELVTGKKIYDDIILPDLEKAINLLDEDELRDGRVNKYAAKLLAARVYFSYGAEDPTHHDKVLNTYLNDLIVTDESAVWGKYSLDEEPINAWANSDDGTAASEVIWNALYYVRDRGLHSPADYTLASWNRYAGAMQANPYDTLWDTNEVRQQRCPWHLFCLSHTAGMKIGWVDDYDTTLNDENPVLNPLNDKRFKQLYVPVIPDDPALEIHEKEGILETMYRQEIKPLNIWVHKYFRGRTSQFTNVPTMRLAEAVLIKAILEYHRGDVSEALKATNAIRHRAGLSPLGTVDENDIDNEWIKELAFEGHRLRYLLALKDYNDPLIPQSDYGRDAISDGERLHWQIPLNERDFQ